MEAIGDRSDPQVLREDLGRFYMRRSAQLQHKKHKLLIRWANAATSSKDIDNMTSKLDHSIGFIQQELDMCKNRLERLLPEDKFKGAEEAERPSPTTKVKHQPSDAKEMEELSDLQSAVYKEETTRLYIEKTDQRSINSSIRQDDFEVYLRQKTYSRKLDRLANKLISKIKWLPYSKRFDMWQESREMIHDCRQIAITQRSNLLQSIQLAIKHKLERFGEQDEKAIMAVTERYVFHLKEDAFISRIDQIFSSYKTDIKRPFMLFASNYELKLNIERLAVEYPTLSTHQMDIDNGQQFTYQMQTLFPIIFEKQVVLAQFEIEDSGKDPDRQLLERLIKNLGLSRFQVLQEIQKYSEQMRKNSILGALSYDPALRQAEDESRDNADKAASEEEFSEQNLIRKIKTIEFFSLNEIKIKLRHSDWLEYVCFSPNVPESQKQQNHLLSSDDNQIDNLLKAAFDVTDVHDQVSINRVMEEAAQAHIQKVTAMQTKVIQGDLQPIKNISGREAGTKGVNASLRAATRPEMMRQEDSSSGPVDMMKAQLKRFEHIQNIDNLNVTLVKNYYSLRLLKTREFKLKLLSLVNYFRAVQRILALDLKEHMTREKSVGDKVDLIEPHFGRDGEDKFISKQTDTAGPGHIFGININRSMDDREHYATEDDAVTINCYKYNGLFDPKVLSTCPMLPKYHRTFGRPSLYESMRHEVDRRSNINSSFDEMKSLMVKRDKILVLEEKKEIKVYNEFGQPIVYSEALTDLVALEEEMIKIGSFYINQHEYIQANNDIEVGQAQEEIKLGSNSRPSSMIDRFEMTFDLYALELDYQFKKVLLVEKLLESYEHIIDPLESVRCLQMIVDVMAQRPRLNLEASLYNDSYNIETKLLQEKLIFFTDFMQMQSQQETEENKQAFDFQEMKVKRVSEAVCKEYKLEEIIKDKRVGSVEANPDMISDEQFKLEQQIQQKLEGQQAKKDSLLEIQRRHITEYANEQYTNFANVLGLPEIQMEDLAAKRDKREPIIQDAIREQAFFTKQLEGYPNYFSPEKFKGQTMGLRVGEIGTLDFLESFHVVPKVNAALYQAFEQLSDVLKPENGLAQSILELCFMKEARLKLLDQIQIQESGNQDCEVQGLNQIEEDFYLGNSDKLMFTMKEFQSEVEPFNLYRTADPLVISKLDIKSVKNYNFPRVGMAEVRDSLKEPASRYGEETADEKIIRRMIDLAKNSTARQLLDKQDEGFNYKQSYDDDVIQASIEQKTVKAPSMLQMGSNMIEALRLREELINRITECQVLEDIYQKQFQTTGKKQRVSFADPINFNTTTVMKDQVNIVDLNHGRNKKFDMAFMEFDVQLSANFDLCNDSCIKALMTELGVEELRGILHYQIMHQHLLTVAILMNQIIIDGPSRGLRELVLLEKAIAVPNPVLKAASIVSGTSDITNVPELRRERDRLKQSISKCSDCFVNVLAKKSRDRDCASKKFHKLQTSLIQSHDVTPEVTLRVLRSYRLKILHELCQNILSEVYIDSIKVQTLQTCNQLRQRASLLPPSKSEMLFSVGQGCVMENMSVYAQEQLQPEEIGGRRNVQVNDILNGSIIDVSLFYVPHSEEVIMTDRLQVELMQERQQKWMEKIESKYMELDDNIKEMVQRPTMLDETFQPGISDIRVRGGFQPRKKTIKKTDKIVNLPTNRVNSPVYQQQQSQTSSQIAKREEENRFLMYKMEAKSSRKYGFRKVNFKEARDYGHHPIMQLLEYVTLILRIYNLEYFMGRNNTPGKQMLEMEQKVITGREFWNAIERAKKQEDINTLKFGDHSDKIKQHLQHNETAADRVIDRILQRKWVWHELTNEMKNVRNRMARTDELAKNLPNDRRNISNLLDLLVLQHQATYYTFLNGIENILEIYRDKGQDEQFYKVLDVREKAIKRRQGFILNLKNGFYISQASVHPGHVSLRNSDQNEFAQFLQQHHPIIDERSLIPKQVNMLQRVYGISSDIDTLSRDCLLDCWMSNYANLQSAFFNLDDRSRSFIGSNFQQLDDLIDNYLIYKGIVDKPNSMDKADTRPNSATMDSRTEPNSPSKPLLRGQNFTSEFLLATVEILSFKIEMAHLQRVMMSWISGTGKLPQTTTDYNKILRRYQKITTIRIITEKDKLNELYFSGNRPQTQEEAKQSLADRASPMAQMRDRSISLDPNLRKTAKFKYFDKVNLVRAESFIIKKLLDIKLVQIAVQMITNEHSALSSAIDFAGSQETIQKYVHPQQQFASTLFQDVDKFNHLDVVQKLGFVQQFLTRLRNRCTEVDTLTSGPGIVFSMKDFNECLSIFCKQALKYSEENLRQRVESSAIMQNQYRHLIYLKEMEVIYYRAKCEQFLRNIDVIVNAKMSAKGNSMIYELDVTNRELRTFKDHYYQMERFMRDEIHKEYMKDMAERDNKIQQNKTNEVHYKKQMQNSMHLVCQTQIESLEKNSQEFFKNYDITLPGGGQKNNAAIRAAQAANTGQNQNTSQNYVEIMQLQRIIRQQKLMNQMKSVMNEEKHQRELKELQLKLTLNASLWEQLSESQKREQITRQELELTKRNLTHYEKLIERLYVQLEQLNNEKIRLQRYKSNGKKKVVELESKMKDLEILENIDLDKILTEMRLRDRKIERLQAVDDEFQNRMETQERQAANRINNFERLLAAEREAKKEAYAKLESMRIEMKALEGTDIKNDLWKDKCKELYEISKELESENDGLRSGLKQLQIEKNDLSKLNEQLIQHQKSLVQLQDGTEATLTDTHLLSNTSRANMTLGGHSNNVRETMILNRNNLTKPLTANATSLTTEIDQKFGAKQGRVQNNKLYMMNQGGNKQTHYGQKRAQSGNPVAARNAQRLYQRNMTNAQSYNYDRGGIGETMQQTIPLSNNTSYPAFSSDVDVGSIGLKQGLGPKAQNQKVTQSTAANQDYISNAQRQIAGSNQKANALVPGRRQGSAVGGQMGQMGYAQSTRTMGIVGTMPVSQNFNQHGVLSSNVIGVGHTQSSKAGNGMQQMLSFPTMSGTQFGPLTSGVGMKGHHIQKNQMSQSGPRGSSRTRVVNVMRGQPQNGQMGVIGSNIQGVAPGYNFGTDTSTSKQQIALTSGSEPRMNIEQAEFKMQNLLQNSSAAVQIPHSDFNTDRK